MSDTQSQLRAAALGALGFAVAISLVHLGHGIGLILALGMPPLTGFAAMSIVYELMLALPIAILLTPLYRLPRGEWLHPAAMVAVFLVIERIVAVDPSRIQMWVAPSLVAFAIFALGRVLYRKNPLIPVVLSLVLPVLLLSLPIAADSMREEAVVRGQKGTAPEGAPDVLMIVMDTTRSQSSSTYGYERDTTPTLDRLADEGLVFLDANAPATWSLPAHAALFTGTFPSYNNANGETRFLDESLPTMAETFVQKGWESYAFSANPHISDSFGLTRGFQHNDRAWVKGTSGRNFSFIYRVVDALGISTVDDKGGADVIVHIEDWMDSRPKDDGPAFVFVNFLEAHFPFRQLPEEYRTAYQNQDMNTLREIDQIAFGVQFGRQLTPEEMEFVHQPLIDLYDGGGKYTDFLVGEVIRVFEEAGRLDNTVVVVLGDHGEVVGEHGAFGHVTPVLEQDFRVPLVFRYPPRIDGGTRIEDAVTTTGTYATVMDLAGLGAPPVVQVGSLMPAVSGEEVGKPVLAERFEEEMLAARFAEGASNGTGPLVNPRGRYRTFRTGPYKLVQHDTDGTFLYNLEEDPGEDHDLWPEADPALKVRLERELQDWLDQLGLPALDAEIEAPSLDLENLDANEKQALCALGYIEC